MKPLVAILAIALLTGCNAAGSPSPSIPSSIAPAVPASPAVSPSDMPSANPSPSAAAGMIREVRADVTRAVSGDAAGPVAAAVAAADAAFAMRLYQELATAKGNLVFSPYSISTALSMTYGGARGKTAAELAAALGIGSDPTGWHAGRNDIDAWLQRPISAEPDFTPMTIEPTNALFGQDGFPFQDAYLELLARDYGAGLQALDFAGAPNAARTAINQWVSDRTKERIRELLDPAAVTSATRFVLVNAIYFKASWATPFETSATKKSTFHRADGTTVDVPLMHGSFAGGYRQGDDWQAVDIPYVGATMTLILPKAGRFAAVEGRLDAGLLTELAGEPAYDMIHIGLPRWSSTTAAGLKDPLRRLGINDLFDPAAVDLRGIADAGLYVSQVIHQATIDVDEKGTEAAAATAVVGDTTGGSPDHEVSVTADRPFIYLIRDSGSGEILFMGRVLDPTAH